MKDCRYGHDYRPDGICRNCLRRRADPDTRRNTIPAPPAPLQHEWETGQLDLPDHPSVIQSIETTSVGASAYYQGFQDDPRADPDPGPDTPASDPAPDFGGGDTGGGGASGDF